MRREDADAIMARNGWLASQPDDFRTEVLRSAVLIFFEAGRTIFRMGDEPGGIYGLVSGKATLNTAPEDSTPKLIQSSIPGHWAGEFCFFSRQPRRAGMQARVPTWLMHLPLHQMDRMAREDPRAIIGFSLIATATIDVTVQIIHDLQKLDPAKRVAATLLRSVWIERDLVVLTQAEIGEMACASRRQVNIIMGKFEKKGWIRIGYGEIHILDSGALRDFSSED